ncbi:ornithine cyclodeaminase family protein [Actinomadura roseirufa]|uniref:ornithine cyclodeaminase family protein n=1 Tax=Actinomadura roseirufa TaxID=2094049 RepID=UPI0010415AB4|nr:ornithine cyclodeaminase family protein [Actinomadura roseirufa]
MSHAAGTPENRTDRKVQVFGPDTIRRAVDLTDLIEPVAQVFADYSRGLGEAPISMFAPAGAQGDVHVKSAWMPGRTFFTIKVASWFTARAVGGKPAGSGFIAVHDATTGDLLAILQDEGHLTNIRTAAAGAVAARVLAREDATTVAVLGTGIQAYLQVLALCAVRPIETVLVWGRRDDAARALAETLATRDAELTVSVLSDAEEAVRRADVVITATASRQPIVRGSWLSPGQHVTAVGADDETKQELDPACFELADITVVDSLSETPKFAGDLRRAIEEGVLTGAGISGELGELLLGMKPGRHNAAQITIAKLIGLGIQDLAAAEVALPRLLAPRA